MAASSARRSERVKVYLLRQLHFLACRDAHAAELAAEIEHWPGIRPRAEWARLSDAEVPEPVLSWEVSRGGQALRLYTVMARLGATADVTLSELTIELFYPADQATEEWLRSAG
jgi:hypothetical protein